jgi:hypothetical protein
VHVISSDSISSDSSVMRCELQGHGQTNKWIQTDNVDTDQLAVDATAHIPPASVALLFWPVRKSKAVGCWQ